MADKEQGTSNESSGVQNSDNRDLLKKNITVTRGIALVVGGIIGTGIFITPNFIARSVGAPAPSIIMWGVGGLIAAAGGMSFCELGTMFPVSGAEIAYIKRIYGPLPAFLTAWFNHFLLRGMGIAIGILGFTKYFWSIFYSNPEQEVAVWADKLLALSANFVFIGLTAFAPTLNVQSVVVESVLKITAILIIIGAGFVNLLQGNTENISAGFKGTIPDPKSWGGAINGIIWSYYGWEMICGVTSEVQNPQRNVPIIVGGSVTTVAALYILAVASYHIVIPLTDIVEDIPIASRFGLTTMGTPGKIILATAVMISSLGNVHCTFLAASRTIHSAAVEELLPAPLALVSRRFKTPIVTVFYLGLVTAVFVLVGDLDGLIDSAVFTSFPFYVMCCVGVFVLRRRAPELKRPYRVPLIFPAFFILFGIFAFVTPFTSQASWKISLVWVVVLLAGVPLYFVLVKNVFNLQCFRAASNTVTKFLAINLNSE